jgi:hypothetical protein
MKGARCRQMSIGGCELQAGVLPALKGVRTTKTWGGTVSLTHDWLHHLEQRIRGCFMRPAAGAPDMRLGARHRETLADLALGRQTDSTKL